jgi:hypothetical protein
MTRRSSLFLLATGLAGLAVLATSCGDRPAAWDAPPEMPMRALGAEGSIAVLDPPAGRVLLLGAASDLGLETASVPIGPGMVRADVTPDGSKILVLARGDVPRRSAKDRGPTLSVLAGRGMEGLQQRYALSDALSGLTIDPASAYAVVHAEPDDETFVSNPNELLIVDLGRAPDAENPLPVTLRSFGGRPERIDFTPPLGLPGGVTRLLVVQTDRDLGLIDLTNPAAGEVTIPLSESGKRARPSGLAVSDGDPDRDDDTRLAVRLTGDPTVVLLDLLPPAGNEGSSAFRAVPNLIALPAVPGDLAFVRTDGGLRLAALVPGKQALALVDPSNGLVSSVDLGTPFDRMTLVTDVVGAGDGGTDVALVWSSSTSSVALVALGTSVGTPYRSVDVIPLETPVAEVLDIPPPHAHQKLLASADGRSFFVLDLRERTAAPLFASRSGVSLSLSRDGARAWAFVEDNPEIASIDLDRLHPENVILPRPVSMAFDVARPDGGRALIALHALGTGGATVLDGRAPSLLSAREYAGFFLGGLE